MIIRVGENHTLVLEDEDNLKGFCIRAQDSNTYLGALDGITKSVEEGNYWLDVLAVIALSSESTEKRGWITSGPCLLVRSLMGMRILKSNWSVLILNMIPRIKHSWSRRYLLLDASDHAPS